MLDLDYSYSKLCSEAYEFRNTECYSGLKALLRANPSSQAWSLVRHYIGRLAAIPKSVEFLIKWAADHETLHRPYQVRMVNAMMALGRPQNIPAGSFAEVVKRALPNYDSSHCLRSITSVHGMNLADKFTDKFNSTHLQPMVHAEIAVLEHFHAHGFAFLNNDRYIGCSKPSCYCCQWYMSSHPMKLQPRLCHGNVWIKWSPVISTQDHNDGRWAVRGEGAIRSLSQRIEQDIVENIMLGLRSLSEWRNLDSITDLSLSLPTVHSR